MKKKTQDSIKAMAEKGNGKAKMGERERYACMCMPAQKTAFAEWRLMASKRWSKCQKNTPFLLQKQKGAFFGLFWQQGTY